MDMYQKRKMRAEKKNNDSQKSLPSTSINWYPGHMAKTKKQIIEDLKLIDVVIELLDARIPRASHNPDMEKLTKNKKKLIVLNKSDLADEKENQKWVNYYAKNGQTAVLVYANSGKGVAESIQKIKIMMQGELKKQAENGKIGKTIRVMILGIPNVGKSSYINRVTKKTSAKVGNKPGVTRQKQWIRLEESIELLDTPGVLWPKLDSEEIALNLAYTGSIKDDILEKTEIAYQLLNYLVQNYKSNLETRYKLEIGEETILDLMEMIGRKRGAIVSGGRVDLEKVSNLVLDDFRSGKLGRMTLEKVEES